MLKKSISSILMIAMLNSCSLIIIPKKQKNIQINTNSTEAKVYVEDKYAGKGEKVILPKIEKSGFKNVQIKVGKREKNFVMVPGKYDPLWYVTLPFDIGLSAFGVGIPHFGPVSKYWKYNKSYDFDANFVEPKKETDHKEVNYLATEIDVKDKENDIQFFNITYNKDLLTEFKKAEDKSYQNKLKEEAKKAKKRKKGVGFLDDKEAENINYDDSYYSEAIIKTLRDGGYIDTSGTVLKNKNNILGLEASINSAKIYNTNKRGSYPSLLMIKLKITWRFVNSYGQIMDSVQLEEFSDQFAIGYKSIEERDNDIKQTYQSAVNNSFFKLYESEIFKKYIKLEKDAVKASELIVLTKPTNIVSATKESLKASVIIKLSENKGHGSGFAITNDGYILTNYHVIAGKYEGKHENFTVIMPDGTEKNGTVVQTNPYYDVALIKVDGTFEKAFLLEETKIFEQLDEVYTVGAPVSIQLGNTLSNGILSGERFFDDISILQLNMAISPGNSGGALFNRATSKLVGAVVSKITGGKAEGIGFAIPAYKIGKYLNIQYK